MPAQLISTATCLGAPNNIWLPALGRCRYPLLSASSPLRLSPAMHRLASSADIQANSLASGSPDSSDD